MECLVQLVLVLVLAVAVVVVADVVVAAAVVDSWWWLSPSSYHQFCRVRGKKLNDIHPLVEEPSLLVPV
jgi:hypothetical protein